MPCPLFREQATLTPLYNRLHHNFFIANFESSMCVDNDDGSAYYLIHDNVCHGGGHKSDFAGHSKSTFNSLQASKETTERCCFFGWVCFLISWGTCAGSQTKSN